MDYSKINSINVDGNGNIVFQDVSGENITVNYNDTKEFNAMLHTLGDDILSKISQLNAKNALENSKFKNLFQQYFELPPEIKQKKNNLQKQILTISEKLLEISDKNKSLNITKDEDLDEDLARQENLLRALEEEKCVLFVGPEISTNENNESLHELFYKKLADSPNNELVYNQKEGFFQPHQYVWFNSDIQKFYSKTFPKLNKKGREVLDILAQLPFRLIISLAPDDTVYDIFKQYDKPCEFLYYDKVPLPEVKCTIEKPVIFNILGSPTHCKSDWLYIFTYNDFYHYIKSAEVTGNIKTEITKAVHYIFIGFDFSKWYFRLLLYVLKINDSSVKNIRHLVEPLKPDEYSKEFLKRQFDITFIEGDYLKFANELKKNAIKANIFNDMKKGFVEKQKVKLDEISNKLYDTQSLTELTELEKTLKELTEKF